MQTYIAVGPHCWGRANTKRQAVANARKNLPAFSVSKDAKIYIYEVHPDTTVTELGDLRHPVGKRPILVGEALANPGKRAPSK